MKRKTSLKRRNSKRGRAAMARSFGEEAKAVRAMPCLTGSSGPVVAAHVTARGMGAVKGGRFDLVPLTAFNHADAGEAGTTQRRDFERCHRLDLRAEADRIALEHERPLGLKGLADRWAIVCDGRRGEAEMSPYEIDAIRGWVRREMAREVERRRRRLVTAMTFAGSDAHSEVPGLETDPHDREALAHQIAHMLGGAFVDDPHGEHGLAWSLCEWAGWP